MERKAILVCTKNTNITYQEGYDYIGIDAGSEYLLKNNFPLTMAIGDFDSISLKQFEEVSKATKVIKLNPIKDETDFEYAVNFVKQQYDELHVYGAIGGRIDHFLAVYHLINKLTDKVIIHDDLNDMFVLNEGSFRINNTRKYLSVFTMQKSMITLKNVKYPLDKQTIDVDDTYLVSNEIIGEYADVIVHSGKVVIVQSDDKKNND